MARRPRSMPPAVVEGGAFALVPAAPPAHRVIHLHNVDALRVELGKVYRQVALGQMDSQVGARLAYLLGELRKLHELALLEQRLSVLEGKLGVSNDGPT